MSPAPNTVRGLWPAAEACRSFLYVQQHVSPYCLPTQKSVMCRELLYHGDSDTVLDILAWIFAQDQQQPGVLEKRALVGFYLSGPEVQPAAHAPRQQSCVLDGHHAGSAAPLTAPPRPRLPATIVQGGL